MSQCAAVEKFMLQRSFECPIFFIEESKDVMEVYKSLQVKSVALTVWIFIVVNS